MHKYWHFDHPIQRDYKKSESPPQISETVQGPEKRPSQGPKNDQNDPEKILALKHIDNPFLALAGPSLFYSRL